MACHPKLSMSVEMACHPKLRRTGAQDGGEGGIRTLEAFRPATLAVWCLQPLGHLSMLAVYQKQMIIRIIRPAAFIPRTIE